MWAVNVDRRLRKIAQKVDAEKVDFGFTWDTGRVWGRHSRWSVDITWWPRGWRNEKEVRSASGYASSLGSAIFKMEEEINGILLRDRLEP